MLSVCFAVLTITAIFQKPLKKPTGAVPEILGSRIYGTIFHGFIRLPCRHYILLFIGLYKTIIKQQAFHFIQMGRLLHLCFFLYEKRVNYSPPNNPLHPRSHRNHHSDLHRDPLGRHSHEHHTQQIYWLRFYWYSCG